LLQATKYANVLAKISAKRSNLLSETKIKTLTQARDLSEIAANLKETIYQERLAKISPAYSSGKFERIFRESLINDYVEVIRNSPKAAKNFLKTYIQRFEIENLKTIIKGIYAELSLEEKKDRIYFQVEDFLKRRSVFEEASKASDIKMVAETMKKTEYSSALRQGLASYEENGTTACLDVLLDKTFYEKLHNSFQQLPKKERRFAAFYEGTEEASYVLLTILRGKNLSYDSNWLKAVIPEQILGISKRTIDALLDSPTFDSALSIVLKSTFSNFFAKAQTPEETIASGEKNFQKALFIHAVENRVTEVFNIGLPLAFMIQKDTELHNLNTICLGIEAEINPEKIQNNLLLSS
jgi:vacuolar-type H+-ATPase subunit C/Vma6